MQLAELLKDKDFKAKEKVDTISRFLLNGEVSVDLIIDIASLSKDSEKATCIEAIEFATKVNAGLATEKMFDFVTATLTEKAPRIKWESAKVIANTAHRFTGNLDTAIANLRINTEHPGTVVRWSAALALGEIVKLNTKHHQELIPAIESILAKEQKISIRKLYAETLKL